MLLMQEDKEATLNETCIAHFFSVGLFFLLSFFIPSKHHTEIYIACTLKSRHIEVRIKITNVKNLKDFQVNRSSREVNLKVKLMHCHQIT